MYSSCIQDEYLLMKIRVYFPPDVRGEEDGRLNCQNL